MPYPRLMPIKRPPLRSRHGEYDPTSPNFWALDTVAEVDYATLKYGVLPYPTVVVQKCWGRMTAVVARCDAYPLLWVWPWSWCRVIDLLGLTHGFLVYLFCLWTGAYIDAGEIPTFRSAMQKVSK